MVESSSNSIPNQRYMKLLPTLLLISSLYCTPLNAQYRGKPKEFTVSIGASFPRLNFGEKEYFRADGFARIGTNVKSDLNLFYWQHMALGLSLHSNFNSINKKALKSWYDEKLYNKTDVDVKAGIYWANSLMLYPIFFDFQGEKFTFKIKTGIGYSFCRHPNVNVNDDKYGRIVKIKSDWGRSLTTSSCASLAYQLTENKKVILSYNRYYLIPTFRNDNYTFFPSTKYFRNGDFYNLDMLHHTINFGYVYHF